MTVQAVPVRVGDQRAVRVLDGDGAPELRELHRADRGGARDRRVTGGGRDQRDRDDRDRQRPLAESLELAERPELVAEERDRRHDDDRDDLSHDLALSRRDEQVQDQQVRARARRRRRPGSAPPVRPRGASSRRLRNVQSRFSRKLFATATQKAMHADAR